MNHKVLKLAAIVVGLACTSLAHADNAANPSFGLEPGTVSYRAPDGSYGVETIDTFTGALKIVTTDLVVPSNGGLDIAITRSYNGLAKAAQSSPPGAPGIFATGIGWDIHFGRVWAGTELCVGLSATSKNRPVLELPDGSRQLFAANADTSKPYSYITRERWIARCNVVPNGLLVISPSGIKYTFDAARTVALQGGIAFHCTKIEHPNGTFITINYLPNDGSVARISSIQHSEGQSVAFEYESQGDPMWLLRRIKLNAAVLNDQRTWTYNYAKAIDNLGNLDYYYLKEVVRPDGEKFGYDYYPQPANFNGGHLLKSVTTPLGGVVTYTHKTQAFPIRDGSITSMVVDTKTTSGAIDTAGTWTYTYEPALSQGQTIDVTKITGPTSCSMYEHQATITGSSTLWRIGLLLSKATRATCTGSDVRKETYSWSGTAVSPDPYWRPNAVPDNATYSPQLDSLTVAQDGSTYTTSYSNFDGYGNAQTVTETGQDVRTTGRTFWIDTTQWIVNKLRNETVLSAGSPGNYAITRNFYSNGDLQNESKAGVNTAYVWHTSGASRGELFTVADNNGKTTTFTNYKRGVAQSVSSALAGVAISRTVNDTGTIANDTNPRSRTTFYLYDKINELTDIQTPSPTDSNISIARLEQGTSSPRLRTKFRGALADTREYDGFGNLKRITTRDSGPGLAYIEQKYVLDAEGRVRNTYVPTGIGYGFSYFVETQYDVLGRAKKITQTDGKTMDYEYLSGNQTRITNERSFKTTYTYRSYHYCPVR